MATYTLPHFEDIDLNELEEYYDTEIELDDESVQIDLNFEESEIDSSRLEIAKTLLGKVKQLHAENKNFIAMDFKDPDGDTVREYIDHHLAELDADELATLVDSDSKISPPEQLLAQIKLQRIGFYPDSEDTFVVFDYSLGADITDYLIVVNLNVQGELEYLSMES